MHLVVKFFKTTSPKAVSIFINYTNCTYIIVIELFPYKLVWNDGLNNIPVEKAAVL